MGQAEERKMRKELTQKMAELKEEEDNEEKLQRDADNAALKEMGMHPCGQTILMPQYKYNEDMAIYTQILPIPPTSIF